MICDVCAERTCCLYRWRSTWVCKRCLIRLREGDVR